MMKVIANYLPQYHSIPENDKWWGEGYTDWYAVKKAKPLYKGHNQPRVPFNNHYYDLSHVNEIRRQAEMTKKYGIYGWGIYHYWFSDEMCLLDKPLHNILENKDIDINFMLIWDNASWKRTWSAIKQFSNDWAPLYESQELKIGNGLLAELKYGGEENWKKHFYYLLPLFRDERYIKLNNKPMFAFFNQDNNSDIIKKMMSCWNKLAKEEGFEGVYFWGKHKKGIETIVDAEFAYEPEWSGWTEKSVIQRFQNKIKIEMCKINKKPLLYSYEAVWKRIVNSARKCNNPKLYYGCFVGYDDSPRRGGNSRIVEGDNALVFEKYLKQLISISERQQKDFIFLTAWNEWGEGAYLEPDDKNGYGYLEAVKRALEKF